MGARRDDPPAFGPETDRLAYGRLAHEALRAAVVGKIANRANKKRIIRTAARTLTRWLDPVFALHGVEATIGAGMLANNSIHVQIAFPTTYDQNRFRNAEPFLCAAFGGQREVGR